MVVEASIKQFSILHDIIIHLYSFFLYLFHIFRFLFITNIYGFYLQQLRLNYITMPLSSNLFIIKSLFYRCWGLFDLETDCSKTSYFFRRLWGFYLTTVAPVVQIRYVRLHLDNRLNEWKKLLDVFNYFNAY